MFTRVLLFFATLAMAANAATSYKVTLFQPAILNGVELKPGDYKIELNDTKATLRRGKQTVEASVKTETADSKFSSTTVRYANGNGKYQIQEIRLGGTHTKLIFEN